MAEHLWGQHAILQPTRDSLSVGDTLMRKAVKQRACKHDRHSYPCMQQGQRSPISSIMEPCIIMTGNAHCLLEHCKQAYTKSWIVCIDMHAMLTHMTNGEQTCRQ